MGLWPLPRLRVGPNSKRSGRRLSVVAFGCDRGIPHPGKPMATEVDIGKFFNGSAPPAHITLSTPEGKTLLDMTGWSMSVPNHKDGNAGFLTTGGPPTRLLPSRRQFRLAR